MRVESRIFMSIMMFLNFIVLALSTHLLSYHIYLSYIGVSTYDYIFY